MRNSARIAVGAGAAFAVWLTVGCLTSGPSAERQQVEVLRLRLNPPVTPIGKMPDAPRNTWYMAYDLNKDGINEYFIQYISGVNKANLLLVDASGASILGCTDNDWDDASQETGTGARPIEAADFGYIYCDVLLILNSKHGGYFDLLTIDTELGGRVPAQVWRLWRCEHRRYFARIIRNEVFLIARLPLHFKWWWEDELHDEAPSVRAYWDLSGYDDADLERRLRRPDK